MLTVNKVIPGGRGLATTLLRQAPHVELDWDVRQRSRFEARDSAGTPLGVFLPRGAVVRGGDVLVAEDGSLRRVRAASQPVMVVRACAEHGSALDLMRAAYHLGNRHVALEVATDHLKLEPDPVLADMLRRRHLVVEETSAAFEPEAGAYLPGAHGAAHQHAHADGVHGHAESHAPVERAAHGDAADWHEQAPAGIGASAGADGAAAGHDQAGGRHDIPAPPTPPHGERD